MLYWRLVYPGDVMIDEPEDQASIRLAPPGASMIAVTRVDEAGRRIPIVGEPLDEIGARRLGRPLDDYIRGRTDQAWAPIFYRRKSLALGDAAPRVDAIVFGRGRIRGNGALEGSVWMVNRAGVLSDCPSWAMDVTAITALVEAG